jgi:hypothetical protein
MRELTAEYVQGLLCCKAFARRLLMCVDMLLSFLIPAGTLHMLLPWRCPACIVSRRSWHCAGRVGRLLLAGPVGSYIARASRPRPNLGYTGYLFWTNQDKCDARASPDLSSARHTCCRFWPSAPVTHAGT